MTTVIDHPTSLFAAELKASASTTSTFDSVKSPCS